MQRARKELLTNIVEKDDWLQDEIQNEYRFTEMPRDNATFKSQSFFMYGGGAPLRTMQRGENIKVLVKNPYSTFESMVPSDCTVERLLRKIESRFSKGQITTPHGLFYGKRFGKVSS